MKNILIKGSGDVTDSQEFFDKITKLAIDNYVVVICGGGTKVSVALEAAGFNVAFDSLNRRITKTWQERKIMRDILENEAKKLEDKFIGKGVIVIPPILYAGSVLCPINGDDLVKAFDLGFDRKLVFTTKNRVKKKKIIFKDYPQVEIIGIPLKPLKI